MTDQENKVKSAQHAGKTDGEAKAEAVGGLLASLASNAGLGETLTGENLCSTVQGAQLHWSAL